MGEIKRFEIFFERHIGFGVRWCVGGEFPLHVSVAFPFFTVTVGFGRRTRW